MIRDLSKDFFSRGSIYYLFVLGGLFTFLALAPIFGFIPYSASPGWKTAAFEFSRLDIYENALFMATWIWIMAIYAIVPLIISFATVRILEHFKKNRVTIVYTSGILCAFLTGLTTQIAGWHILIDTSGVIVAFLLGLIVGLFILPIQRFRYSMLKE